MTVFSYPSELVDPYPDTDAWINAGIARATSDIAVAAWITERDDGTIPMHLAAIRYTDAGPEMGPTYTISTPSRIAVYQVIEGQDTEVWIVAADSDIPGIKLGVAKVDIMTLELTFGWRFSIPSRRHAGWGGVLARSWTQQNLIVLAANEGDPAHTDQDDPWVHLVDMTTGAVIESVQPPRYDPTDTSTFIDRVYPEAIALHKESGRLLMCGTWYDTVNYQAGLWSIMLSSTEGFIDDWTKIADIPKGGSGYWWDSMTWASMTATADGWSILAMPSSYSREAHWLHLGLDGTLTEGGTFRNASAYANSHMSSVCDCAYDAGYDRSIGCFVDWGTYDDDDKYLRGFIHLEARGATISTAQALPKSDGGNLNDVTMINVAVVGPGRYIYLCASTGILRPRGSGRYDSFGPFAYVGGEKVDVSLRVGSQTDDTKQAFRTVRTS